METYNNVRFTFNISIAKRYIFAGQSYSANLLSKISVVFFLPNCHRKIGA